MKLPEVCCRYTQMAIAKAGRKPTYTNKNIEETKIVRTHRILRFLKACEQCQ